MLLLCGEGQDYDENIHINGGGGGVKGNKVRGEAALARAGTGALESLALYDAKAAAAAGPRSLNRNHRNWSSRLHPLKVTRRRLRRG